MLVRHHSVPCLVILEDYVFAWNPWRFDWRFYSRDLWSNSRVFIEVVHVGLHMLYFLS